MVGWLQQIGSDVLAREVVVGHMAAFEEKHGLLAIDDGFAVEGGADAACSPFDEDNGF